VDESVLANISFPGFGSHSTILPTGELIPVPEPGSIALLLLGALALLSRSARRR
jgi:hypothetical protein